MIIPFFIPHSGCPHQCVFCNQKRITGQNRPPDVSGFPQKINRYLQGADSDSLPQIAFYGGSFTALPLSTQKSYLEAIQPFIRAGRIGSVRISTRPDGMQGEILDLLKEHHVETVELGAQSMDDEVLTLSGRGHTASETVSAVSMLRKYEFKIGLQLMPGLPGDSKDTFLETITTSIHLKPDFIRLYPTIVIADTPLEKLYRNGGFTPLSLADAVSRCKDALLAFEAAGIEVIRIGLQATDELDKEGNIIAGPYHPAFRQLVESSVFLDRMRAMAGGKTGNACLAFLVNPVDVSNAIGQKQANLKALKKEFGLTDVLVWADAGITRRTVKAVRCKNGSRMPVS